MVRIVASVEELLGPADEGRCYVDRSFLIWGTPTGVGGHAVWGRPDTTDVDRFVAALGRIVRHPDVHPRRIVADFRALEHIEMSGFKRLRDHLKQNRAAIERLHIREAVLHPDGIVGSVVAGFYAVAPKPHQSRNFADVDAALQWLSIPDARSHFNVVERVRLDRAGAHPQVRRLRNLLEAHAGDLSLGKSARALGASARSLQRDLRSAGSSFREEQAKARLEHAARLLATDAKLTAVALDLGFSTQQHFATWFRQQTGQTPSAWRRTHSPPLA